MIDFREMYAPEIIAAMTARGWQVNEMSFGRMKKIVFGKVRYPKVSIDRIELVKEPSLFDLLPKVKM